MNVLPSLVRTLVPYGVGAVLAVAAVLGLDVSEPQVVVAVTAVVTGVYYTAFRILEAYAERISWRPLQVLAGVLLGWARPPRYPGQSGSTVTIDLSTASEQLRQIVRDAGGRR